MHVLQPPALLRWLTSPWLYWRFKQGYKTIYLTFDDGPYPGVTREVIRILEKHQANATFFCLGKNILKHPEEYKILKESGQCIGNHTFSHLNGWKSTLLNYREDVQKSHAISPSPYFRPPYGKLGLRQMQSLSQEFKIIMWDVMSYDFDPNITPQNCAKQTIQLARDGSIVVFHDTPAAGKNCLYALEKIIEHFSSLGYSFPKLDQVHSLQPYEKENLRKKQAFGNY